MSQIIAEVPVVHMDILRTKAQEMFGVRETTKRAPVNRIFTVRGITGSEVALLEVDKSLTEPETAELANYLKGFADGLDAAVVSDVADEVDALEASLEDTA